LLDDPVIVAVAQRVHKTAAQVLLAWAVPQANGGPACLLGDGRFVRKDVERLDRV
jgi:hypothetical protein